MTTAAKGGKPYRCSFCGKSQDQVRKLIAGQGVYICDECITLCREIVDEEFMETPKARASGSKVPSPRRINEILDQYVIGKDRAKRVLSVAVYTTTSASAPGIGWTTSSSGSRTSSSSDPPGAAR